MVAVVVGVVAGGGGAAAAAAVVGVVVVAVGVSAEVNERQSPMRGTLLGVHHSMFFGIIPLAPLFSRCALSPHPPSKNS